MGARAILTLSNAISQASGMAPKPPSAFTHTPNGMKRIGPQAATPLLEMIAPDSRPGQISVAGTQMMFCETFAVAPTCQELADSKSANTSADRETPLNGLGSV